MKNSSRYFENRACEYFPCHAGMENLNCLFCYCPLYRLDHCPGTPGFIEAGEKTVKDCSACTFPHRPENYDAVIRLLAGR